MDALPLRLAAGDPAPMFFAETSTNSRYAFHSIAGRYVVLGFFASAADAPAAAMLETVALIRPLFDDKRFCFFAISRDPKDRDAGRLEPQRPGRPGRQRFDRLRRPGHPARRVGSLQLIR